MDAKGSLRVPSLSSRMRATSTSVAFGPGGVIAAGYGVAAGVVLIDAKARGCDPSLS